MKPPLIANGVLVMGMIAFELACSTENRSSPQSQKRQERDELAQVPSWSTRDLEFFLHGSMSTEMAPEAMLRAFISAYPDLFPSADLTHFGLIPDPQFGWPVGFSRATVGHLGGMPAVGINCAACHVGEVTSDANEPVRVLGMTSLFDAEAFFGALIVSTFRTMSPDPMRRFLEAYLQVNDPEGGAPARELFNKGWNARKEQIAETMAAASSFKDIASGGFYELEPSHFRLDRESLKQGASLEALSQSMIKLFHNIRTALHVPDQLPEKAAPSSGPGRNDAFGLLSLALFGRSQPYAPVKYGLVWNLNARPWVHWDGNTQSPVGRNLLASLGLGAPLMGRQGRLDFAAVQRQTELSEQIAPPQYPFVINAAKAARGQIHYKAQCASCHEGPETDNRLHLVTEVGTEPTRALAFTATQAELFNRFLSELEIEGYEASHQPGIRSTTNYWAASLAGVWARSPYLHNGSVRTMEDLLRPPASRAPAFHRGARLYDTDEMGYRDEGPYLLDTRRAGNSNSGHDYGTMLSRSEKAELIEFLKTL